MPPKAAAKSKSAASKAKAEPKPKAKADAKAKAKSKASAAPKAAAAASTTAEASAAASSAAGSVAPDVATAVAAAAPAPAASDQEQPHPRSGEDSPASSAPVASAAGTSKEDADVRQVVGETEMTEEKDPDLQEKGKRKGKEDVASSQPEASDDLQQKVELLASSTDPWSLTSDDEAMQKIADESWEVVLLAESEGAAPDAPSSGVAQLAAKEMALESLPAEAEAVLRPSMVSLDLTENELKSIAALPALWLRHLVLANNPLVSANGVAELFPRLLHIDLSFVDLSKVQHVWEELSKCKLLRVVVAESCSVSMSTLTTAIAIPQIKTLDLQENEFEEVQEDITALATCFPGLVRLDLRENPVASEAGYRQAVRKCWPALEWHDNQSLKKFVAKRRDEISYSRMYADVDAVDGLHKNEHCSCLEGNPCIEQATCKDWANREKIAAEARRLKGLRDESGKQL